MCGLSGLSEGEVRSSERCCRSLISCLYTGPFAHCATAKATAARGQDDKWVVSALDSVNQDEWGIISQVENTCNGLDTSRKDLRQWGAYHPSCKKASLFAASPP